MGRASPETRVHCAEYLNGKWLAALGVVPGQKIRVITNRATLTLAPVSFESGELTSIARPKSAVLQH
jgi:hypothetical protein